MSFVRETVVDKMPHDQLLALVIEGLEELGISYEMKPGGFGEGWFPLYPPDLTEND